VLVREMSQLGLVGVFRETALGKHAAGIVLSVQKLSGTVA
jgi:hypothetical protein